MIRKTAVLLFLFAATAAPAAFAQTLPAYPFGTFQGGTVDPGAAVQAPQPSTTTTPTIRNAPALVPVVPARDAAPARSGVRAEPPTATQAPIEPRNEFQEFIENSTGQRLPLFGYNLFEGAPSTFAPVENIPVTPDYAIGPGDELLIRAWGQIDIDYRAVVDRNGMINIPRVGSITVAGIRYQELTNYVRSAVSRNYRNFELLVTMGQLRSIQVFVVGYAKRPGAYTVSSLSTLVNAVFSAGGPASAGSMRAIQLKRGERVVTKMDLYDLLLAGDKSKDAPLLPGDVIYIPAIGPLAAVTGSVNNPAIFELKGETSLGTLMGYAGGLATTAQSKQVTIERIDNRAGRVVDQLDFNAAAEKRPVMDGDLVSVLSILPKFDNAVTLRGNVATPLRHPYRPGMRIRDLIPEKDALITPEYYRRKNLAVRTEPSAQARPAAQQRASIAVSQNKLIEDVRALANEVNWDYAVIERLNKEDLTTKLIPFNLGKAVLENDPANNLPLLPGDVVTVFSKSDVAASTNRRSIVVSLEGEFAHAGVYQATQGETLRQLVVRVGGLTLQAYVFGADLTRESTRKNQEDRLELALNQLEEDVQRAAATRARNVTSPEDAAALAQQAVAQQALVARLRTLKPTGRIVLEMPEDAMAADLPDIALEDGDRLRIPRRPSMVSVFGAVFNESTFLYRRDKTVADYLGQAGGPRKEADKGSIYVIRADGSVVSQRQSGLLMTSIDGTHPMPGDAIVVPENFERTTWTKDLKDWSQIFFQFGLGAAAIRVIQNK